MLSFRPKPKRLNKIKTFTLCFMLPVMAGIAGNICIKSKTGDKSIEHTMANQMGIYTSSDKYALEASQYKAEIEKLKVEKEDIRKSMVSRGDVQRIVQESNEQLQRGKVIQAISNNLKGAFNGKAPFIFDTSKKYNVNPMLVTAIMIHETGNGSSTMCINNNNPAGITTRSGGFVIYNTLENGIEALIKLLKTNYIDCGLQDIESIGNKFCPLNDRRDTQGVNKYWIPMVTRNYIKILEESK